jgi:hypothetical protein
MSTNAKRRLFAATRNLEILLQREDVHPDDLRVSIATLRYEMEMAQRALTAVA